MSTDTAIITRKELPKPRKVKEHTIIFQPKTGDIDSLVLRQINDILSNSLEKAGFLQPAGTTTEDLPTPIEFPTPVLVAPGIVVDHNEYKQRYGCIDLEQYKQQMSPELFKAFIRHIGCIPGTSNLDLKDIVNTPE